jgi:hypothetical protein
MRLIPGAMGDHDQAAEEAAMMLGDLPRPGWHTWATWIVIVLIGLSGFVLFWALKF